MPVDTAMGYTAIYAYVPSYSITTVSFHLKGYIKSTLFAEV